MVAKFEKTGSLNVQSGRGRKSIVQDTVEEVATAIVGRAQQYCLHFQCSWGISEYEHAIQCSMENLTKDYTLLSIQNQQSTRITLH